MFKQKLVVASLFLAGCVVGGVSSQLVVPPARAGSTPPRWEYFCTSGVTQLQEAGRKGWELVTAAAHDRGIEQWTTYCLKRPLP